MTEEKPKDEILELIRLIDRNKSILFRTFDVFRGEWAITFSTTIVLLGLIEVFLLLGNASNTEKITIALALIAVIFAFFSLFVQFGEENIVQVNYKRLEECVRENEKPIFKALLKIKVKSPKFDLEQIYKMNKSMFTKGKLLEKLYE